MNEIKNWFAIIIIVLVNQFLSGCEISPNKKYRDYMHSSDIDKMLTYDLFLKSEKVIIGKKYLIIYINLSDGLYVKQQNYFYFFDKQLKFAGYIPACVDLYFHSMHGDTLRLWEALPVADQACSADDLFSHVPDSAYAEIDKYINFGGFGSSLEYILDSISINDYDNNVILYRRYTKNDTIFIRDDYDYGLYRLDSVVTDRDTLSVLLEELVFDKSYSGNVTLLDNYSAEKRMYYIRKDVNDIYTKIWHKILYWKMH